MYTHRKYRLKFFAWQSPTVLMLKTTETNKWKRRHIYSDYSCIEFIYNICIGYPVQLTTQFTHFSQIIRVKNPIIFVTKNGFLNGSFQKQIWNFSTPFQIITPHEKIIFIAHVYWIVHTFNYWFYFFHFSW